MNDPRIEELLRKAPRPAPPPGLKDQLIDRIALSRSDVALNGSSSRQEPRASSWWRRWAPTLAFGMLIFTACVLLAVQTGELIRLRKQNDALRPATANLEQLRQLNQETQNAAAQAQELERLRRDQIELEQLRTEAARLRQQTQTLTVLRAENQRLQAELAARRAQIAATPVDEDPFAEARARAQRIQCVNNLKQIGLAARIWANDHQEVLPTDFLDMTNELSTPKILACPADTSRTRSSNWAELTAQNLSYEILAPGLNENESDVVFARCPVHQNVVLTDGSVHQLSSTQQIIEVNGRKKLGRNPSP